MTLKLNNSQTAAALQHSALQLPSFGKTTTGERKEATEWHRIATSNRLAEIASKYLKKGGKVYVEGSLRTRKWKDSKGVDREVTEIRADELQLL